MAMNGSTSRGPQAIVTVMDLISDSSFDSSTRRDIKKVRKSFMDIFEILSGQKIDPKSLKKEVDYFSVCVKRDQSKKQSWLMFKTNQKCKLESRVLQPASKV